MALIIPNDLTLRTEQIEKISSANIDKNNLYSQALSLASSNSLIYLSEAFSVDSNTPLGNPALGSFNSRTIPSFLYRPFANGCNFVFKFSATDYGYYASASTSNQWWSVLASDTSYKIFSISQINSATPSYPSYNNWEFNLTSLSFTSSTWTVTGTKIMGPTFSNFEPEASFVIGYRAVLSPTFSGGTGSIGGVVDGYTYFDYPTLQNRMYIGDLSYQIEIGVTGSIGATGATGGTGSIVTVGGEGMLVNRMYLGDLTYPIYIGATSIGVTGSSFSGTGSIVTVGGEGMLVNRMYLGDLNQSPISISNFIGDDPLINDTFGATSTMLKIDSDAVKVSKTLYVGDTRNPGAIKFSTGATGSITLAWAGDNLTPGNSTFEGRTCYQCQGETSGGFLPPTRGGKCNCTFARCCPAGPTTIPHRPAVGDPRVKGTDGYNPLVFIDDTTSITADIIVNTLTLGSSATSSVNIAVLDKIDSTPNTDWEPDLVVSVGRFVTSSQSSNIYDVGLDAYNLSTSHLEITPIVYTSSFTNIHMYGTWGTAGGGTNSTLYVESDAVSVNKLFFGDITNGQSLLVSGGNLYLNGSTFSGGTSSGSTGPQGPQGLRGATGAAGTQLSFQYAWQTLPSVYGADEYVTYGGSTWFTNDVVTDGVPPSPTNSNWTLFGGAALIVGTAIPNNSSSPGAKGEIRVDNGQFLYIHTGAQWLKSSMTFSTF